MFIVSFGSFQNSKHTLLTLFFTNPHLSVSYFKTKTMKKKPLLLLSITFICFLIFQQLHSQSTIYGVIKNDQGKALESANVLLLKSVDSSLVKGMITDAFGKYSFEKIKAGNYLITATFSGMN